MRHEPLVLQRDLQAWQKRCTPLLAMDLHAPGAFETTGVYSFLIQNSSVHPQVTALTEAIRLALGEYAGEDFARVATYDSRWDTPNAAEYFCNELGIPGLSLETSYQAAGERVLTIADYREIGARIARELARRA